MGSVEVSAGRGVGEALRLDQSGGVVVKWIGASVVPAGDGEVASGSIGTGLDDGKGVAHGDVVSDAGRDADAPRRLTIRAAVGSEDRKGDVIDANGWELDGYRRNPVFLWAHDRSRPPIGKSKSIWVEDGALYAEVEFAPTDFAGEVAGLYERGFMRGVSVGFLPLETELRKASNGRRGYLYRRQELLEISAVPVPMHDGALASSPSRSEGDACQRSEHAGGAQSSENIDPLSPPWERARVRGQMSELRGELRRLRVVAEELVD